MSNFKFKEIDDEGRDTLDVIATADNFNRWMYETIKPYCDGKILEIGSGIGNISKYFVTAGESITLSDIRDNYCSLLIKKHGGKVPVVQMNLTHPQFDKVYKEYLGTFNSVFALNVVEHIQDDLKAIQNCYKLLKANGKLIILVPAYQQLYNRFDKELEHYRRYTKNTLNKVFTDAQFEIIHSQYFNFTGIMGWYVSGKLQNNKTIPKSQMSIYNTLVPIFKLVDKIVLNKVGLSVISIGLKK